MYQVPGEHKEASQVQNGLPAGNFDYYQLATGLSGINKVPPPYGSDMPEPFDK